MERGKEGRGNVDERREVEMDERTGSGYLIRRRENEDNEIEEREERRRFTKETAWYYRKCNCGTSVNVVRNGTQDEKRSYNITV